MDLLEFGIRQAETLMGLPLRTDYVGLLVADVLPDLARGRPYRDQHHDIAEV